MIRILQLFACCVLLACSNAQEPADKPDNKEITISPLKIYEQFSELQPLLQKQNDTTYVVNFWATWCKPCVAELPYFEAIHNTFAGKPVKVLLVSLDFPDKIETKLIPFLEKNQLKSEVVVLTDGAMNSWIPQISDEWSGAIPATFIYKKDKKAFYEQSFDSEEELNLIIKPFITSEK